MNRAEHRRREFCAGRKCRTADRRTSRDAERGFKRGKKAQRAAEAPAGNYDKFKKKSKRRK